MKLVEILARELGEWPDGAGCVWQSEADMEVYFGERESFFEFFATEAADDRGYPSDGIGVTREEWEAERAKVEGKTEWDGEGLPPVGVVCLGLSECDGEWKECEIVSHHKGAAVAVFPHGGAMVSLGIRYRPAPSAEQIAAQEREEAITDLMQTTCIRRGEAARIYDAGYRKQEQSK